MVQSRRIGWLVAIVAVVSLLAAPLPALATLTVNIAGPGGYTQSLSTGGTSIAFMDTIADVGVLNVVSAVTGNGPPFSFLDLTWVLSSLSGSGGEFSIIASADFFTFPASGSSRLTSTLTNTVALGSGPAIGQQWVDLGNHLFAAAPLPDLSIFTPGSQSGSFNQASVNFSSLSPYSITDQAIVTLGANSLVAGNLQSTVVPEPITMFLGGTGLLIFGYAGRKRLLGR
jgi:hypothetical protein